MDFSYIHKSAKIDESLLLKYGFSKIEKSSEVSFSLKKLFSVDGSNFYVDFEISKNDFFARVFEVPTNEPYVLFEVSTATGRFVSKVRQTVFDFVKEIEEKCFIHTDVKKKYIEYIQKQFNVEGDNPFSEDSLDTMIFRTPKNSWFALLMTIKFKNLGIQNDSPVSVVNLKHRPEDIPKIVDNKHIFNAYHMSKKHWISVILSDNLDFSVLQNLTEESFSLVNKK